MAVAISIGFIFLMLGLYSLWQDRRDRGKEIVLRPLERSERVPSFSPRTKAEVYRGDILEELSRTTLHIMFGVMSGAGKSTSMKAIIWKIHTQNPTAKFIIVDPKTTDWLGLQLFERTVFYLSGDILNQLLQLKQAVAIAYDILDDRISKGQRLLELGGSLGDPEFDIYLIIDEWFALHDALKKLPAKLKAERGLNDILLHVNALIAKGREHRIHVFLVAQTHLSTETGISTAMRRSLALVGQGRLTPDGDGGYASIEGIINDSNVFKHGGTRKYLTECLQIAIAEAGNLPVIMTTMGTPRIGLIGDLSHTHSLKITDYVSLQSRSASGIGSL
ncbi:type IV secretory system conjugative DNA transfer family protein [Tumidithrix helvetica PCC 7403]|uniref:hypothetical protein n=1 Tax=Tumidithrix helvetica TaxID=3457545 RepID=UPI003CAA2BFD